MPVNLSVIVSILSGGIGGSLASATLNFFAENRKAKKEHLKEQLDKLYVPLHFKLSQFKNFQTRINEIPEGKEEEQEIYARGQYALLILGAVAS